MAWQYIEAAREFLDTETGTIARDWGGQVPVALVYPNSYAVGMSSLAIHSLYSHFNALPGVLAERAFAWLGRRPRANDPVLTLESQRSIAEAAIVAVSVSFEMDYFYLVSILRRAGIPVRATEREEGDPLVILGGPAVSANPMPLKPLADAIVIGEIEPILPQLGEIFRGLWTQTRDESLAALAQVPGVYAPLYHHGEPIVRQQLDDLDAYPTTSSIIAPKAQFGDMHLIEISRGCGRGCRFCLAGTWYRPHRERSLENLLEQAREGLAQRGDAYPPRIGLVASAVSDHSQIDALALSLQEMGAQISVSSLRIRPLSQVLVDALAQTGSRSITLAPEAGSDRLRGYIRKGINHGDIMRAVDMVNGRFESLKLYFMIGLPKEDDNDIGELLSLAGAVKDRFDRQVVVNLTPFVPKAHTPFQRMAMASADVLEARMARIREGCRQMRIELRAEAVDAARIQGALSRGDSRVGEVLLDMPNPTPSRFERALGRAGLSLDEELDARLPDAALPWDLIRLSQEEADCPPLDAEEGHDG